MTIQLICRHAPKISHNRPSAAGALQLRNQLTCTIQKAATLDHELCEEDILFHQDAAAMAASCSSKSTTSLQNGNHHAGELLQLPTDFNPRWGNDDIQEAPCSPPLDIPNSRSSACGWRWRTGAADRISEEADIDGDDDEARTSKGSAEFLSSEGSEQYVWKGRSSSRQEGSMSAAPPHEIAAGQRLEWRREVMAFSMVEGCGRTLKGRDLTNVRNAVWHTIGFPG